MDTKQRLDVALLAGSAANAAVKKAEDAGLFLKPDEIKEIRHTLYHIFIKAASEQ